MVLIIINRFSVYSIIIADYRLPGIYNKLLFSLKMIEKVQNVFAVNQA